MAEYIQFPNACTSILAIQAVMIDLHRLLDINAVAHRTLLSNNNENSLVAVSCHVSHWKLQDSFPASRCKYGIFFAKHDTGSRSMH